MVQTKKKKEEKRKSETENQKVRYGAPMQGTSQVNQ